MNEHLLPSLQHAKFLHTVCASLFSHIKIKYFGYTRFFKRGLAIGLYTDPDKVQDFLSQRFGPPFLGKSGIVVPNGSYFIKDTAEFLPEMGESENTRAYLEYVRTAKKPDYETGMTFVHKSREYDESFHFVCEAGFPMVRAYYGERQEALTQFCRYFLWKAKPVLQKLGQKKSFLSYGTQQDAMQLDPSAELMEKIAYQGMRCTTPSGDVYLSQQEYRCFKLWMENHTHIEIADELSLSRRTVESYLMHVKNKLQVKEKRELADIFSACL